ncbi:MAG: hypothetical protein IJ387_05805 [Thermoguttaceae bacterium]|nr:hypothetical protein [Thermoguttaceae bacterium]
MSLHLKSSVRGPIHTDPNLRIFAPSPSQGSRSSFEIQSKTTALPRLLKIIGVFSAQLSGK